MTTMFLFPGTAAILLRTHTYMSDIAVQNWLRNYGKSGEQFWVKSVKPGNHHFQVIPVAGGFLVRSGMMSELPAR